jgi:hypothetical protein
MLRRKRETEKRKRPNVPKDAIKPTVGFVVRIHAGRHTSDDIKSQLRDLGLNKKYDAKFMKLDDESIGKPRARIFTSSAHAAALSVTD